MVEFCGVSLDHAEEGICRQHLAERWDLTPSKIHHMIKSGRLEAGKAEGSGPQLTCGVGRRGDQIVPFGMVLNV